MRRRSEASLGIPAASAGFSPHATFPECRIERLNEEASKAGRAPSAFNPLNIRSV